MTKTHVTLIAGFVLTLAAGFVAGWATMPYVSPHPQPNPPPGGHPPTTPRNGRPSLAEQLHLTPDQAKQMEAIWSGVTRGQGPRGNDRIKEDQEREDKIAALIGPDRSAAYDKLMQDYHHKTDAAVQEARKHAEQDRDTAIDALLPPDQAAAYHKIIQDYRAKSDASAAESRKAFDDAVAATLKILTPEQRTIYENLLQRRTGGRGRGNRGPGGRGSNGPPPTDTAPHGDHD